MLHTFDWRYLIPIHQTVPRQNHFVGVRGCAIKQSFDGSVAVDRDYELFEKMPDGSIGGDCLFKG
jgi:hypothetical protein